MMLRDFVATAQLVYFPILPMCQIVVYWPVTSMEYPHLYMGLDASPSGMGQNVLFPIAQWEFQDPTMEVRWYHFFGLHLRIYKSWLSKVHEAAAPKERWIKVFFAPKNVCTIVYHPPLTIVWLLFLTRAQKASICLWNLLL